MTGADIINEILAELKLKVSVFSKSLGYERPQKIYDIQKGKTKNISNELADDIVLTYPQFNKSWVLTGEGSMLKSSSMPSEAVLIRPVSNELYLETNAGVKYYEMENGKFRMKVPLVPFNCYGRFIDETTSNIVQEKEEWDEVEFVVDQIGHGNYVAFEVKGDSMDDDSRRSFVQGDIVLARELNKIHWKDGLRYEKFPFWVIVLDSTILIKQITDHNTQTGDITCHSLNPSPEYQDFTVNLDNVYRIFNVIQRTSTF